MKELLDASFSAINFIPTVFLCITLLYWCLVVIGAFDLEMFEVDIDADLDVDMDVELDADMNGDLSVDTNTGSFTFIGVIRFLNIGRVPFMVFFSFFSLNLWAIAVFSNHYLGVTSIASSIALLVPNILGSLILSKIFTQPFVGIFKAFNKAHEDVDLIGELCEVVSYEVSAKKMGQAELMVNNHFYTINIKAHEGELIKKGSKALIIDRNQAQQYYTVQVFDEEEHPIL